MQKQPDLAKNLINLFNPSQYKAFGQGEFENHPEMTGYYYIFQDIRDPKFCILLNTSKDAYPTNMAKIKDYVFIIFNIKTLEEYIENMGVYYFPEILNIINQNIQQKDERNLPYGYYTDVNGDIKIDIQKANEVRRIYNKYLDGAGVRQIANELRTNFSHVRDVLASNPQYAEMQEKILPPTKLKKIAELLAQNVKSRKTRKISTKDKIDELRRRRKQTNAQRRAREEAQAQMQG